MIVVATSDAYVGRVSSRLGELGARVGSVIAPSNGRTLVLAAVDDEWEAERITGVLRTDGELAVTRPDRGVALDAWAHHTRPIVFGDRLSVCFAWSEHDRRALPGPVELGLGGFGNGQHPSTRLVIEELMARVLGGERVLDVGCGSGVLGLCALGLGAARVMAVDIEADAVAATRRNAALNGVNERMEVTHAPLGEIDRTFDIVVANVGRAAIVEVAGELVRCVSPSGWLVVSGFSPPQCSQVVGFLRPLVELDRRTCDDWSAIVLTHR